MLVGVRLAGGDRGDGRGPHGGLGVPDQGRHAIRIDAPHSPERPERGDELFRARIVEHREQQRGDARVARLTEGLDGRHSNVLGGIVEPRDQGLEKARVRTLRENPHRLPPHLDRGVGEGLPEGLARLRVVDLYQADQRACPCGRVGGLEPGEQKVELPRLPESLETLDGRLANVGVEVLDGGLQQLFELGALHPGPLSAWGVRSLTRRACYRWPAVRTLALDYGRRRIGVAVSDPSGTLAQPLETIDARRTDVLSRVGALVEKHGVTRIVVGLPMHMDGREGPEAEEARAFGASVEGKTGVPVQFLDERWTTVEADRTLERVGVRSRNRKGKRDRIAAALLLRVFLEREGR